MGPIMVNDKDLLWVFDMGLIRTYYGSDKKN
jgi:hypothetical protein